MKIYFRACGREESVSGVSRWKNKSKVEIIKKCWLSLQQPGNHQFIVILDEVSKETTQFIQDTAIHPVEFWEVPKHNIQDRLHTFVLLEILEQQLQNSSPDEIHYLVEDDYLHTNNALGLMETVLKECNLFVVPYDYPDRYTLDGDLKCNVFTGPTCHWRTVPSATYTFTAKTSLLNKSLPLINKIAPHNPTIELFKQTPCICPLPGVATHLTSYHMTLYTDWKEIWNQL